MHTFYRSLFELRESREEESEGGGGLRDCRCNLKGPSMLRKQCPIYNGTLETLIWLKMCLFR